MPKLWNETIEAHREAVRTATFDAVAEIVGEHGLRAVTMARVAGAVGVGRATVYKYFPDVEALLLAWHERVIATHISQLEEVQRSGANPRDRLEAVLSAYAGISRQSHGSHDAQLSRELHGDEHVAAGERRVHELFRGLIADAVVSGDVRADVPPSELASYCLGALSAARGLPSTTATRHLVEVTLSGLRP